MSLISRFTFDHRYQNDPDGRMCVTDRFYRRRMGFRKFYMGMLFVGLVVALDHGGGYFAQVMKTDDVFTIIVASLFLVVAIYAPIAGLLQMAGRTELFVSGDGQQITFRSSFLGRERLVAETDLEELEPEVQEAITKLIRLVRGEQFASAPTPDSEPIFEGSIPIRLNVLEGGSLLKVANLTPEKDFVPMEVRIHPEAIVIHGTYDEQRLGGVGAIVPVVKPKDIHHTHILEATFDSGLLLELKTTRKGFELNFRPAACIVTDFPRAKEVRLILRPNEDSAELVENAILRFRDCGTKRTDSQEYMVLTLGRKSTESDSTEETQPEDEHHAAEA